MNAFARMTALEKFRRAAGALLALCCAAAVVSCQGGDADRGSIATADVPDQEFSDFTTLESDSALVKWMLKAPVARVYNARKLLVTDDPRIEFFDGLGQLASILTSDKGEYNQVTHDLTALGHVVVTSVEGYVLETETLVWVEKLNEIHSEDFVKFTRGSDVLTGYGLRGDPGLRDVEIKRNVKAYLRDEDGRLRGEFEQEGGTGGARGE
jgi:LPS export ABC transporter protein LptC